MLEQPEDNQVEVKDGEPQLPESTPSEEDPKSRTTQQFEKLKESNQELKKERDHYKNILESLQPEPQYQNPVNQAPSASQFSHLNQQDINQVFAQMVDENGYLDGNKLTAVLGDLNKRALQAEQAAAGAQATVRQMQVAQDESRKSEVMKKVHEKYPQLDPESDQFDEKAWKFVRNEMIGQLMEGKEDPMAAAQKWYNDFYKDTQVTKEEKQQKIEADNAKKQINAIRPRSPMMAGYYADQENQALIEQVRQGKKGALAEMLKRREQGAQ